jgi:hypothetical protein
MSDSKIVISNILEIRLKERLFSFLDYKGELIDFLIQNYGFEKIKYSNNGTRIDVATGDLREKMFFSLENFGFQYDGSENFEDFKSETIKILKIISDFGKYKFNNLFRIGTKSIIYYYKQGKSFESWKDIYKHKMFKESDFFEKISSSKLVDFGYSFNDVEMDKSKASILTGPVEPAEAIIKFFDNDELYKKKIKNAGFMYIVDCYTDEVEEKINEEKIKDIVFENIKNIEKSFNSFRNFLLEGKENK